MKTYSFSLSLLVFLLLTSCENEIKNEDFTLKGFVFGTTYKITYLDAPKNYQKSIDSLFRLVNKSVSTYMPKSDISKINSGDTTVIVDKYFKEIFKKSKRIYKETNGFFDPTVGNLVNAWGFGPKKEKNDLTKEEIVKQMKLVGLDKVDVLNNKVVKQDPAIYLDFNSIGKGFGIDVIARFLESKHISNYLVEIGGEIRAKGTKKKGKPWVIKLVDPIKSNSNAGYKILNLSNKSMATSGNYRKFRIANNGKKYVHTINPKTGYALESNLLSASVIANLDCADVDGYATAFMAMGLEKTKDFIKNNSTISVILIYLNKDGNLEEFTNYTYK
ncbi:FAD:protein FMN transferase [Polaribacter cellanae]|uniref:FAD:protein FMN transferase n=1 Tax=Polaribacter cellanae TaxID=2818493 RepID=A0A975H832_9FLAO|nr:FAD:protein FMN transferase [Polaribacter cellanae]QTE24092.1 FAD:protein FMN transferase [Polaribacter cellanae]